MIWKQASNNRAWQVRKVGKVQLKEAGRFYLENKKPTGCLLGACSGQHPMGYRFSLLTLLFSGVFVLIKPQKAAKFRLIL
jgi:hypothetical protein